ncbi:MAG: S8 family serine peptidase [Cyclonatronaceae bacterium]
MALLAIGLLSLTVAILPLRAQSGGAAGPSAGVIHLQVQPEALETMKATGIGQTRTGLPGIDALLAEHQVERIEQVFTAPERFRERHQAAGLDRWFTIYYASKTTPEQLSEALGKLPSVAVAEPDYRAVSHEYTGIYEPEISPFSQDPDMHSGVAEPDYDLQWHYENLGFSGGTSGADINLPAAWDITSGSPEVIVQVIDSGIDINHIDLDQMLWENPNPGEGSFSDDVNGWNFVNNDNDIRDGSGHGTHVSGTIAAQNNGIGAAGIAGGTGNGDGIRMMIMRIFQSNGVGSGESAGANRTAQAIVYGADRGAVISNNSWGYTSPNVFPDVVKTAIDYFIEFAGYDEDGNIEGPVGGGVFISSAGNTPDGQAYFPAAYEPVISVAATDHNDQKTSYSNYGEHVTISAPGGQLTADNSEGGVYSADLQSVYSYKQGTSMASPHVAGVAALIASHFQGITSEELISRLVNTADSIDEQNPDHAGFLGSGRVNAGRALTEEPAPGRPALISPANDAVEIPTNTSFSWDEAVLASAYDFQLSTDPGFETLEDNRQNLTETTADINDLQTSTTYYWRVRASNDAGAGLWSDVFSFETSTVVSTEPGSSIPSAIELAQNYPNPFNPGTQIRYTLDTPGFVELSIYSISGQKVATLEQAQRPAGTHTVYFDASALSSGVYLYRLQTEKGQMLQRRMTLIK